MHLDSRGGRGRWREGGEGRGGTSRGREEGEGDSSKEMKESYAMQLSETANHD